MPVQNRHLKINIGAQTQSSRILQYITKIMNSQDTFCFCEVNSYV